MRYKGFDLQTQGGNTGSENKNHVMNLSPIDDSRMKLTPASTGEERKVLIRHKHYYLDISEGNMPTYPVEQFKKEWIMERLQYAMVEALFKQGLLTEAQRRELCRILKCDILNSLERR